MRAKRCLLNHARKRSFLFSLHDSVLVLQFICYRFLVALSFSHIHIHSSAIFSFCKTANINHDSHTVPIMLMLIPIFNRCECVCVCALWYTDAHMHTYLYRFTRCDVLNSAEITNEMTCWIRSTDKKHKEQERDRQRDMGMGMSTYTLTSFSRSAFNLFRNPSAILLSNRLIPAAARAAE